MSPKQLTKGLFGRTWRPTPATNWRNRGDALRDARKWLEAAEAYGHHLERHPMDTAIWIQHGHMLKEAGRLEEAISSYNRSEELDPHDADRDVHMFHLRDRLSALDAPAPPVTPGGDGSEDPARPAFSAPDAVVHGIGPTDTSLLTIRLRRGR